MSILLFILVLVFLIVVHEIGHFAVAKFFGVRVDEFGVGYPPRAWTLGKIGETTYSLNWLPFGGFVRIFGERESDDMTPDERRRAFISKPRVVQAAVLVAGVVFNLLLAWLLFTATLMIGAPTAVDESRAAELDTRLIISSVVPGSPADTAGLQSGDRILGVEAESDTLEELTPSATAIFMREHVGDTVVLSYSRTRSGEIIEDDVMLSPAQGVLADTPSRPAVGIAMALVADQALPFYRAVVDGFVATWNALKTVTVGLAVFFATALTGTVDWAQVAGPVGIAGLIGDASSVGFVYLLYFTAFISVNLAVINLIPLPALDGGRLLFVVIEGVTRKKISERVTTALNIAGFALIILLMVVVTYHDIVRLIG